MQASMALRPPLATPADRTRTLMLMAPLLIPASRRTRMPVTRRMGPVALGRKGRGRRLSSRRSIRSSARRQNNSMQPFATRPGQRSHQGHWLKLSVIAARAGRHCRGREILGLIHRTFGVSGKTEILKLTHGNGAAGCDSVPARKNWPKLNVNRLCSTPRNVGREPKNWPEVNKGNSRRCLEPPRGWRGEPDCRVRH